jgi:hypothetical protein
MPALLMFLCLAATPSHVPGYPVSQVLHVTGELAFTLLSPDGSARFAEFHSFQVWRSEQNWRIRVTDPPNSPGSNLYDEATSFEGGYIWRNEPRVRRPSPDPRTAKFDCIVHAFGKISVHIPAFLSALIGDVLLGLWI